MIKKLADKSFLRFILVGIINTVCGTSIMFVAYNVFRFSYWVSSALNYVLVSILSYFLNKYFTFKNNEKSVSQILRFALTIVVCYVISYGIAKPLIRYLLNGFDKTIQENAAMLAGMVIFTILNYAGQRFFAFRKSGDNDVEKH